MSNHVSLEDASSLSATSHTNPPTNYALSTHFQCPLAPGSVSSDEPSQLDLDTMIWMILQDMSPNGLASLDSPPTTEQPDHGVSALEMTSPNPSADILSGATVHGSRHALWPSGYGHHCEIQKLYVLSLPCIVI